jgi:hypothetical protein
MRRSTEDAMTGSEEQRGVATALRAELAGCRRALLTNIQQLNEMGQPGSRAVTPDLAHAVRIMPHIIQKLGLLDEETIDRVANAYLAIDEHGDMMLLFGGHLVDPERSASPSQAAEGCSPFGTMWVFSPRSTISQPVG